MFPIDDVVGPGGAGPDNPIVTGWEPPHEFRVRMEGEDGWFNALESLVEARDSGTCVLLYVHSGIFVDDGEGQYDGAAKHTTFYLRSLGQYVQCFSGPPVTYVAVGDGPFNMVAGITLTDATGQPVNGPSSAAGPDALEVLSQALGLTETGGEGERVRLDIPGLDPIDAALDCRPPHFIGLRSEDALPLLGQERLAGRWMRPTTSSPKVSTRVRTGRPGRTGSAASTPDRVKLVGSLTASGRQVGDGGTIVT